MIPPPTNQIVRIDVNGISAAQSSGITGAVKLVATQAADSTVAFITTSSTFHSLTVEARYGIRSEKSITTQQGPMLLDGGAGTLTVFNAMKITSSNQQFRITVDDIDLQGSSGMTAGIKAMTIHPKNNITIGLGTANNAVGQMRISENELQRITAAGLTLGNTPATRTITVAGIAGADSGSITGVLTLAATDCSGKIAFLTPDSTFHSLTAQSSHLTTSSPRVSHLAAPISQLPACSLQVS